MGEAERRRQAREQFERQKPEDRLGDAPIEAGYHQRMTSIAAKLDVAFNGTAKGPDRPTGFVLLVFPFGDRSGRCNYISNGADRRDVLALLKEMVSRFSGAPDQSGTA